MDFSLNETQQEVRQLAGRILAGHASPERMRQIDAGGYRFDHELWSELARSGLSGVGFSAANGGMGLGFTELCLLAEEVGRSGAAVPVVPVLVSAGLALQKFGSAELQQRLLPGVVAGQQLITAGLLEVMGENPAEPATVARPDGSGFRLTGCKIAVPFADRAERILVTARLANGIGIFLLDPAAVGVSLVRQIATTREPWFEVTMNHAEVAAADLLVNADNGAAAAAWIGQHTITAYCAMQLGITDFMMRTTAQYTCQRYQFDVPIGSFQAVQHRAADSFIDVQCLRLVTYQAASLLEAGADATNEVLIAKIWAGDAGHRVSYASQHLHGGAGIDREYHLWRYCLWARQIEMILGSSSALLAELGERIAAGKAYAE